MKNELNILVFFIMALLVTILGVVVLQYVAAIEAGGNIVVANETEDLGLFSNNSPQTLAQTPLTTTATALNNSYVYLNSDYINFAPDANIFIAANHTFSVWINSSESPVPHDGIFGGPLTELVMLESGQVRLTIDNVSSVDHTLNSSITVNDGEWHNIIVTVNNATRNISLYIDGVIVDTSLIEGAIIAVTNEIDYGYDTSSARRWTGEMDEIRQYTTDLSGEQILEIYNSGRVVNSSLPSENLFFWNPLNENSGSTSYDISGNGHNATYLGSTTLYTDNLYVLLTEDTDYSISGNTFNTLNNAYAWTPINVSYTYNSGTASNYGPGITLIQIGVALIILGFILMFVMLKLKEYKL